LDWVIFPKISPLMRIVRKGERPFGEEKAVND